MLTDLEIVMTQRVMTTGGYPVKMPDAEEIASDVTGDVMGRKISINQLSGMSETVNEVLHAKTPKEIRDAAGIQESQIAVKGDAGESAYELAQQQGFTGTLIEWLSSLHGADGSDGKDGLDGLNGRDGTDGRNGADGLNGSDGKDGSNGVDGKSAYQIARDAGYGGTETQWLDSLKGADGKNGLNGSDGKNGADGKNGVDGTNGVNGKDGANGKSAYEVAVANGYSGTQVQWLASLKGADGKDGTNGTNGKDGANGKDGVNATTTTPATTSANGLMSSSDKAKLDAINAPVFNVIASGGRPVGTAFTID